MALQLDFTQLRPLHQISLQYRVLQLHDQELECLNLLVKVKTMRTCARVSPSAGQGKNYVNLN